MHECAWTELERQRMARLLTVIRRVNCRQQLQAIAPSRVPLFKQGLQQPLNSFPGLQRTYRNFYWTF